MTNARPPSSEPQAPRRRGSERRPLEPGDERRDAADGEVRHAGQPQPHGERGPPGPDDHRARRPRSRGEPRRRGRDDHGEGDGDEQGDRHAPGCHNSTIASSAWTFGRLPSPARGSRATTGSRIQLRGRPWPGRTPGGPTSGRSSRCARPAQAARSSRAATTAPPQPDLDRHAEMAAVTLTDESGTHSRWPSLGSTGYAPGSSDARPVPCVLDEAGRHRRAGGGRELADRRRGAGPLRHRGLPAGPPGRRPVPGGVRGRRVRLDVYDAGRGHPRRARPRCGAARDPLGWAQATAIAKEEEARGCRTTCGC